MDEERDSYKRLERMIEHLYFLTPAYRVAHIPFEVWKSQVLCVEES